MNKKTLIVGCSALGVLMLVIGIAVASLYSDHQGTAGTEIESVSRQYKLVEAVPSDAAIVFFSDNFKDAVEELTDSTLVLRSIFTDTGKNRFSRFLQGVQQIQAAGDLKPLVNRPSIVSVHYSGNLSPLMMVDGGSLTGDAPVFQTLTSLADSFGLYTSLLDGAELVHEHSPLYRSSIFLISSSEALLLSSRRHLENGDSILDAEGFPEAVSSLRGEDAIAVSHNYAGKLLRAYGTRKWGRSSDFFRSFGEWTVFRPYDFSSKSFSMNGHTYCGTSTSYYANVLSRTAAGESQIASVLPVSTVAVLSLPFQSGLQYMTEYRHYLDANEELSSSKIMDERLRSAVGVAVEKWVEILDIKEVAKVTFKAEETTEQVLMARIRKENQDILLKGVDGNMKLLKSSVQPYAYGYYLAAAFGEAFSLGDGFASCAAGVSKELDISNAEGEFYFTMEGNWLVSGSRKAVDDFRVLNARNRKLYDNLVESGVCDKTAFSNLNLFSYVAFSDDRSAIRANFTSLVQQSLLRSLNGISYFPIVMTLSSREGQQLELQYHSARLAEPLVAEEMPVVLDTVVIVPEGPYPVKNCHTGKMNTLVQNSNHSLSLKDENGKGMWSIPFSQPICGRVENIDYYANGKLQFLFCAGSSLYLLDRLGRFVRSFPVNLGKEVALGPAAYDFTGAHGYTAMVLFKDNTIEMFNLHGVKPEKWKGIQDKDTILRLPELLRLDDRSFWVVRTARQTLVYPFYGGEPLFRREGGKMLRPDTEILVKGNNSISVTCHDGKRHTVKLK